MEENNNISIKIDMTGWKMWEHGVPDSRLTVLCRIDDYISPSGNHKAYWKCICSCPEHNIIDVVGSSLRQGLTLSCGCIQKERASIASTISKKKYNKYDLTGSYGIGWTSNTNKEFYFDLKNYEIIKDCCWAEITIKNVNRLIALHPDTKKHITMHELLGFKNYDHIDRNELNNLESNLRPCIQQQNTMNRSIHRNNTSGFTGVSWNKDSSKWCAQIGVDYETIYLGSFSNKDDAIKARLNAEEKYFGKFAPQRHLFEQYGINTQQNDLNKETDNK